MQGHLSSAIFFFFWDSNGVEISLLCLMIAKLAHDRI